MNTVLRRLGMLAGLGILVGAALKEFGQPKGLRLGEGKIFGIPYNFRLPNKETLRERYWNADAEPIAPPIFGVGYGLNLPAIAHKLGLK